VISGNRGAGIGFLSAGGDTVEGDFIGTDATGQHAVGNVGFGVFLEDVSGNSVAYNAIDFSGEYGLF
jgi:hypothetical protein